MGGRHKSAIWNYFKKKTDEKGKTVIVCSFCQSACADETRATHFVRV